MISDLAHITTTHYRYCAKLSSRARISTRARVVEHGDGKARKRMSRKSKKLQDEFTWLEFRNVRGNTGWLCSGADTIAFERKHDFVLIDRHPLLQFAEDRCDLTDFVEESSDAIYKAYTREGRQDLISIVSMDDMMTELPHTIWGK